MATVFLLLAAAGLPHPYLSLATGWLLVALIEQLWARAVVRERERSGAPFFGYRFWARYAGWAVFSGFFCFLLPVVTPKNLAWWQIQLISLDQPLSAWIVFVLTRLLMIGWLVLIPLWGLVAMLTAPEIGLLASGLRLVPLPTWPVRDLAWGEIERVVVREPKGGTRRDPVSYLLYLRDGSYVPVYTRMMRDPEPLIAAITSHSSVEHEVWRPL